MDNRTAFENRFRRIQLKFSRFYARLLTMQNLTLPQYALLGVLMEHNFLSMTDVSKELLVSKPAVTNLVDRLEKARCIERTPHPEDRRVWLIGILPQGKKIVRDTQTRMLRFLFQALAAFSASEQRTIGLFYQELAKHIDAAPDRAKTEPQR